MTTRSFTEVYVGHACANCGVTFYITDGFDDRRRDDGASFYCPNGHSLTYRDTLRDQLKREREKAARLTAQLDQTRADRDAAERSRSALKGQVTRVRNRIGKGVCPCCNRTFADLARHMETKHPEYANPAATTGATK